MAVIVVSAAAVNGCGGDGIFSNWRHPVGSIPLPPQSMTTIVDEDLHRRRRYRPPPLLNAAAVNDDRHRRHQR